MPSIKREGVALTADDINDAFDFLIDDNDTITVTLEVYAKHYNGKKIPEVLDREYEAAQRKAMELNKRLVQQHIAENPTMSYVDKVVAERDLANLDEAMQKQDELLARPTTKITAIFQRPDATRDGAIRRESVIEVFGKGQNEQPDETAHIIAVLTHCLKSWDLKQSTHDGGVTIVPCTREAYAKMHTNILAALVLKFKQLAQFGLPDGEYEKN